MQIKELHFFILLSLLFGMFSCSKSTDLTEEEKLWLQQNDNIKVAVFPHYTPYQFINTNGDIDGVFIEYLELIEKKINYKFQKKTYTDWTKLIEGLKKNDTDFVLEIQKTNDKSHFLNFHPPLFETINVIVARKNASFGNNIHSLQGKKIILPKDYAITENIKNHYPNLHITTSPGNTGDITCLQKVADGTYDAYLGPRAMVNYTIRSQKINNLQIKGETEFSYESGLAVRSNKPILNSIIAKAINQITKAEEEAIFNNWVYNTITPLYRTPQFWILLSLVALFIVLLITSLNYYLKHKIKQRSEELLIAKEIADESNKLKTNFINNIPYEIKTPMNGISDLSKILDNDKLSLSERRKFTKMIIRNSKLLISMIDNILEVSKLQTRRVVVKPSEFHLNDLLHTLRVNHEAIAEEKNIDFTIQNKLLEHQNLLITDKPKLQKILTIVIENAINFTDHGSVSVFCSVKKKKLLFHIKDTGVGISEISQNLINENFSKLKTESVHNPQDFRLGLIVAKKDIDHLGGKITFTSKKDKGSTFIIEIPYDQVIKTKAGISIDNESQINKSEKYIILIAEDNKTNYLFLKTILSKMVEFDFIIYRAKNGKEAITICHEQENIDLILMDIKMPIMDGYEATRYIKKLRPHLPIIAQTAFSVEEDIQKAFSAGCDDFITKPIDRNHLRPIMLKYFSTFKKENTIKNTQNT